MIYWFESISEVEKRRESGVYVLGLVHGLVSPTEARGKMAIIISATHSLSIERWVDLASFFK